MRAEAPQRAAKIGFANSPRRDRDRSDSRRGQFRHRKIAPQAIALPPSTVSLGSSPLRPRPAVDFRQPGRSSAQKFGTLVIAPLDRKFEVNLSGTNVAQGNAPVVGLEESCPCQDPRLNP